MLHDPQIGDWNVEVLLNQTSHDITTQIAGFFQRLRPTDTALMYLSGYCRKVNNELYFPLIDTDLDQLIQTALSMRLINNATGHARARRVLQLFDLIVPADIGSLVAEPKSQPPGYRDCIAVSRTLPARSPTFASLLIQWLGTSRADPDDDGYVTSAQLVNFLTDEARNTVVQNIATRNFAAVPTVQRVATGFGSFPVAHVPSEPGNLITWLTSGGARPAFVRLPADWSANQLADAAERWFQQYRSPADLISLIGDRDIFPPRRMLENPGTWTAAKTATVEDLISASRPGGVPRALVWVILASAMAELAPGSFDQVLTAGLERMAADTPSQQDELLLDDIPVWLMAHDKTYGAVPVELLRRLARLLSQVRTPSVIRAEIAIYLAFLIDRMRGLIRHEPEVISEARMRVPASGSGPREVRTEELIRRCRRLVVLAGAWSGKTLLAAGAALDSARAALIALGNGTALAEVELPIFTTCADLQVHGPDLRRSVVNGALAQLDPLFETLFRADADDLLGQMVPVLLVLDALDEVRQPIDDALREIDTWHWRIVLTSRPSAWRGQLSIPADDEGCVVAELVPMRDHLRTVNELVDRFERTGDQGSLEEARQILDLLLRVTGPSDPERAACLSTQLWLAERSGDQEDLERSLRNLRRALSVEEDPLRPRYQLDLAHGLRLLAQATGDLEPLNESIAILAQASREQTDNNPEPICDLYQALLIRWERTGRPSDLVEAARLSDTVFVHGIGNWQHIVSWAEHLRRRVDYPLLATEHLLVALDLVYRGPTRRLIESVLHRNDAVAQLGELIGLQGTTWLSGSIVDPDLDFSGLRLTANVRRVLAEAARATSRGSMVTDSELLVGLLAVPDCVATRWLVRTCGLPAERLREIVRRSLDSDEPLAELFWRARAPASYALRLEIPVGQVGLGGMVDVFARLEPVLAGDEADDGYRLDAGSGSAELNLLVRATGFRIEGDDAATLSLDPRDIAGSARLSQSAVFQLTALRPGQLTVSCSVFRGSDYETVLEGSVSVAHEMAAVSAQPWMPARVRSRPAADLTLEVRPEWRDDLSACTLVYRLTAARADLGLGEGLAFRSKSLAPGWLDRVRSLLAAAVSETTDTAAGDAFTRLRSFGQYLGDLVMPADLQRELAGPGRARTLQVIADEDVWAPWELMHDGSAFLAERYVIGRWPRELAAACPSEVPLGPVSLAYYQAVGQPARWAALVQPAGAPAAGLLPGGVLRDVAATQTLPGLHLVRQTQPEDSGRRDAPAIAGQDGESELAQVSLTVRRERPVVTVGYVRKDGVALAALEQTWAMGFLRARSSAFAGPLWAVEPAVDAAFTARFYERLWAGAVLGEAFRAARILARAVSPGSPDWLAYVLFADPMSRPYRPVQGSGYATVERIGADLDEPLRPGQTARFRASLRRAPPVWHEDRVLEVVSEFRFEDLELRVLPSGVDSAPADPIPLSRTPDGDYRGWFTLTAPSAPREEPAFVAVYFVDRSRPVHSLTFPVTISPAEREAPPGGERG